MSTIPVSFRVTSEVESQLEELSRATDRPKSWHLEQAVRSYLETQLWQIRHIRKGIAELDAGKSAPHAKVVRYLKSWGKPRRKRAQRSKASR